MQVHERGCHAAQLAVISQDLWFSQMKSTHLVGLCGLGPGSDAKRPFEQVVQVALQCRDVLETLNVAHAIKTSGPSDCISVSSGLPTQGMRPACVL